MISHRADDRAQELMSAQVSLALLRQGGTIDRASGLILIVAVIVAACDGLLNPITSPQVAIALIGLAASAIFAGLAEKYFYFRVGLDSDLLQILLDQPNDGTAFDQALADSFGKNLRDGPKSFSERYRGAMRLWRRQVVCLVLQCAILAAVITIAVLSRLA